jgi:hypothetical protein
MFLHILLFLQIFCVFSLFGKLCRQNAGTAAKTRGQPPKRGDSLPSLPERPRASQGAPERPRAPQNAPARPRTPPSLPERPRASQGFPERPRASQGVPDPPRASQGLGPRASGLERPNRCFLDGIIILDGLHRLRKSVDP